MPLSIERLMSSDLYIKSTGEEFKAAFTLWCASWKQSPPGSIPNEEKLLKFLSCAGAKWKRVRNVALHGFVLCNDNRYYHPVIADMVMTAWEGREKLLKKQAHTRVRNQIWRANKGRLVGRNDASVTRHETLSEASHDACVTQERRVCDASRDADVTPYKYKGKCKNKGKDLKPLAPSDKNSLEAGDHNPDHDLVLSGEAIPLWNDEPAPASTPPANGAIDSSPILMEMPVVGGQGMFSVTKALRDSFAEAYPALDVDQCLRAARLWLEANPSRRKTAKGMKRFLAAWLERSQNSGRNLLTPPTSPQPGGGRAVAPDLYETNAKAAEEWLAEQNLRENHS